MERTLYFRIEGQPGTPLLSGRPEVLQVVLEDFHHGVFIGSVEVYLGLGVGARRSDADIAYASGVAVGKPEL